MAILLFRRSMLRRAPSSVRAEPGKPGFQVMDEILPGQVGCALIQ